MIPLDRTDLQLLAALQRDGRATNPTLGERVHLSASQVSRRIQRLEEAGLVDRYVTLLRPARLGLTVIAYTRVSLERHGEAENEDFNRAVQLLPEVLECYAVTGPYDYLLRIVAADLAAFGQFMLHKLMRVPGVRGVESSVVLQEIKRTTELPLEQAQAAGAAT
ncbi:MAG TPA: Lrp/AsnC family transcriptional regulator [Zeimonas sp.]|jgi:Lrp/AsnC family leucine-responsive transcriptional regulator|nr:Lrp/AsnC family transcriptional regulator [Zeimonas sp.]